jgi:hypothetical protein
MNKLIRAFVGVLFFVAVGSGLQAQNGPDAHWRVVTGKTFKTVVAYDTTRVTKLHTPGRYDVWERYTLNPPRVDSAGVVSTIVLHVVLDCPALQSALKLAARYDKTGKLLGQTAGFSSGENDFTDENPGSVEEAALKGICAQVYKEGSHS